MTDLKKLRFLMLRDNPLPSDLSGSLGDYYWDIPVLFDYLHNRVDANWTAVDAFDTFESTDPPM